MQLSTYIKQERVAVRSQKSSDSNNELELIIKAQRGDDQAFESLVLMYKREVLSIFRGRNDAEDLASEVMVRIYLNLSSFKPEKANPKVTCPFRTWIWGIGKNLLIDQVRKDNRRPELPFVENEHDREARQEDPEKSLATKQMISLILDRLSQEKPDFATALRLKYLEELSPETIAAILGISVSLVNQRVFRALKWINVHFGIGNKGPHART